jgi:hypothetical protein
MLCNNKCMRLVNNTWGLGKYMGYQDLGLRYYYKVLCIFMYVFVKKLIGIIVGTLIVHKHM